MAEALTPALGRSEWTGVYDTALRLFTRERRGRATMPAQIAPQAGHVIVDVGCGSGTLALTLSSSRRVRPSWGSASRERRAPGSALLQLSCT